MQKMITPPTLPYDSLPVAAKNWIITAIVFAFLSLVNALFSVPMSLHMQSARFGPPVPTASWVLLLLDILAATAFIRGAAKALRLERIGPVIIRLAAIAAAVLAVATAVQVVWVFHSPAAREMFNKMLGPIQSMQPASMQPFVMNYRTILPIFSVILVLMTLCQALYYICLAFAMSRLLSGNKDAIQSFNLKTDTITTPIAQARQMPNNAKLWIISAIIFATVAIMFKSTVLSLFIFVRPLAPRAEVPVEIGVLAITMFTVPAVFIFGGVMSLRRKPIGLTLLKFAAVVAGACVIIGFVFVIVGLLFTSGVMHLHEDKMIQAMITSEPRAMQPLFAATFRMVTPVMIIFQTVITLCQLGYYVALFINISKVATRWKKIPSLGPAPV